MRSITLARQRIILAALFALTLLAIQGCGGGKDSIGFTSEYTGLYRGSASRVTTSAVLSVAGNGAILASITDSGVVYTGSVNVGAGSSLSMNLVAPGAATIRLTGFFAGSAATGPSFNGNISNVSGGFSVPAISLGHFSNGVGNAFVGPYTGSFTLDPDSTNQGSLSISVANDGKITGTGEDIALGSFALTGTVSKVGVASFSGRPTGADAVNFSGSFIFVSGDAREISGTWESGAGAKTGRFVGQMAP